MKKILVHLWLLVLGAPLLLMVSDRAGLIVAGVCWLAVLVFFGGRLIPKWMRRYIEVIVSD